MKHIIALMICTALLLALTGCAAKEEPMVGIATPFTEYATIEEARKALGCDFSEPAALPDGLEKQGYTVWNDGSMAEIHYQQGEASTKYRVSPTLAPGDMNGDYNQYDNARTLTFGGIAVDCLGNGDTVSVAMWKNGGFNHCLLCGNPLSEAELQAFIESIA